MSLKTFSEMRDKRKNFQKVVEAIDSLLELEAKVDNANNLSLEEQEKLAKEVEDKFLVLAVKISEV